MHVSEIFDYLIKLEREGYTGQITLNFHRGDISKEVKEEPPMSEDV